jgi:hypothetical protein
LRTYPFVILRNCGRALERIKVELQVVVMIKNRKSNKNGNANNYIAVGDSDDLSLREGFFDISASLLES